MLKCSNCTRHMDRMLSAVQRSRWSSTCIFISMNTIVCRQHTVAFVTVEWNCGFSSVVVHYSKRLVAFSRKQQEKRRELPSVSCELWVSFIWRFWVLWVLFACSFVVLFCFLLLSKVCFNFKFPQYFSLNSLVQRSNNNNDKETFRTQQK